MYCANCGNKRKDAAKFCGHCGNNASDIANENEPLTITLCDVCGKNAPAKYNAFYANIGMLFQRRQMQIVGNLCKDCTNKYFWKFTLTNLFLGSWGIIFFFATIIFIINNMYRYIGTITLKKNYQ